LTTRPSFISARTLETIPSSAFSLFSAEGDPYFMVCSSMAQALPVSSFLSLSFISGGRAQRAIAQSSIFIEVAISDMSFSPNFTMSSGRKIFGLTSRAISG